MDDLSGPRKGRRLLTIVLLETDEKIRSGMRRLLRGKNYRVFEAASAEELAEVVERGRPDLILTNTDLPDLEDLLRRVRGNAALRDVAVAAVSPDDAGGDVPESGPVILLEDFDGIEYLLTGNT